MVDQPDFENMTPEEITAWMETLAKRQGATEGFTTDADLDIPEIDPDTVVIDEPGYVPYSESRASSPVEVTQVRPSAQPAPPPPRPAAPPEQPVARPPAAVPPAVRPSAPPPTPAPAWAARAPEPPAPKPDPKPAPEPQGSLAWLESLAQQNDDNLFNLDLSGLGEEAAPAQPTATDPSKWLESMAAAPDLQRISGAEPSEDTDSLRWLESLARRQGAPADELTTSADLDVGEVKGESEAPAYTPFSFDTAPSVRSTSPRPSEDPAAFLGSLAASEGYSEGGVVATREQQTPAPAQAPADEDDIEAIKRAINEGRATSEQMQTFFEHQMDVAESLPPGPDELGLDDDEPAVPADLPDWLLEGVQVDEPPPPPAPPVGVPPLESLFDRMEPEIPDWLREQEGEVGDDLQSIFAQSDELDVTPEVSIDLDDPWVEALDLEHDEGMTPVDTPPEWYLRNVNDPARLAALDEAGSTEGLSDEALPVENELPAGEPQPVPEWIEAVAESPTEPADDGIPEWLHEMENIVTTSEIPAWLNEPVDMAESDELPFELEDAPATPEFVIDTPPTPAEPVAEPSAALENARQRRQAGDSAGALAEYEALIRANVSLQDCVDDLAHVAKVERDNPVVFRVLGDGYMRLGKLQLALDTYREALNYL